MSSKFSGYSLTTFVFTVILLLRLNIYWEVSFGGWHFLLWLQSARTHWATPHSEAVITNPCHLGSGQCPKVKPVMGFLKLLSTPEWGKSQEEPKFSMSRSFKRAWAWHGWGRTFYSVAVDRKAVGMTGGVVGWGPSRKGWLKGDLHAWWASTLPLGQSLVLT